MSSMHPFQLLIRIAVTQKSRLQKNCMHSRNIKNRLSLRYLVRPIQNTEFSQMFESAFLLSRFSVKCRVVSGKAACYHQIVVAFFSPPTTVS